MHVYTISEQAIQIKGPNNASVNPTLLSEKAVDLSRDRATGCMPTTNEASRWRPERLAARGCRAQQRLVLVCQEIEAKPLH
jgi:hypothetical protein